jgi:uncharacterized repeat protein (TIGR03803 family)
MPHGFHKYEEHHFMCVNRLAKLSVMPVLVSLVTLLLGGVSTAQTVKDVYSFTANGKSGAPAHVTLAQGRDGKLYGTSQGSTFGTVFTLQTSGAESDLFVFDNTDGAGPSGGVILGTDGNFYGTTAGGGSAGLGVLYKISPSGLYTVLHEFTGGSDGSFPVAAPIEASDGNFYGTTEFAANFVGATIYKYTPSGVFTTIDSFDNATVSSIAASLVQGTDGNLYGAGYYGGANNCGSIFKINRSGTLLRLFSFFCGNGGANPIGLMQASDGNLYGTTQGSKGNDSTVFKMDQRGKVTILHTFTGSRIEGKFPEGGLVQATDGNLYGSTSLGGSGDNGTLYQITTDGAYTQLYSFPKNIGVQPMGALLQDTNGLFYGTTLAGGASGIGSVFSLNMGLGPFVAFVRPTGGVGHAAQILGQGLTGATSVTFNSVAATSFTVVNDTYMTAVVPIGATTGKVIVTTPGGTLTSNVNFRILQ